MTEEPVQGVPGEGGEPAPGIALCLSGGGYRAMLFHLGALWRLNEAGYLPRLERSLERLRRLDDERRARARLGPARLRRAGVARQLRSGARRPGSPKLAGKTIDIWAIVLGILLPGSIGNWYARSLKRNLLGRRDPAGHARPAALHLQRDQPPIGRPLALLEAVHARLHASARSRRRRSSSQPRSRRPARFRRSSPRSRSSRSRRTGRPGAASNCSARRTPRRSSSPTAGSTTTSGWRPRGSATRRS